MSSFEMMAKDFFVEGGGIMDVDGSCWRYSKQWLFLKSRESNKKKERNIMEKLVNIIINNIYYRKLRIGGILRC